MVARLINRALKMMHKVVLGLGHMRGCTGHIWGGGSTLRRGRAHQRGRDVSVWSRAHPKKLVAYLKGLGCSVVTTPTIS